MKNIFDSSTTSDLNNRINALTPTSKAQWGKMDVAQMLAHCNVAYEMVYSDKHPRPNAFMRFFLKLFVKKTVVNDVPYKQNGPTGPQFVVKGNKDFAEEKARLIDYIKKTQELGAAHFDNKESHSMGKLTSQEWNNSFYKHLDHHFRQFGV